MLTMVIFLPTRATRSCEWARFVGAFSGMHRALDGWILACPPASPAQGKASTTMDLGISIFLISVQYVALINLDLLIKTG